MDLGFIEEGEGVVLIKDKVLSPGTFLLHLILRKLLSSSSPSTKKKKAPLVVFLALSEPFSHYAKIARKQGCNLSAYQESGRLVFLDLLAVGEEASLGNTNNGDTFKSQLFQIYLKIRQNVRNQPCTPIWIIVDDISLLEIVANGSGHELLDFIHYCRTLSTEDQRSCSMVLLTHDDAYQSGEEVNILRNLEHWAKVVLDVEPLSTGHASDVHGQVTMSNSYFSKGMMMEPSVTSTSSRRTNVLHFKITETGVQFFAPGKGFNE